MEDNHTKVDLINNIENKDLAKKKSFCGNIL